MTQPLFNSQRLRDTTVAASSRTEYSDARNEFESDLGRALFSSAARRLHDKTQVIPLTTDDNIHSRLTHSMEVMNIGASLAKDICYSSHFRSHHAQAEIYDIYEPMRAILQTICLVHDIGNPPFGHFGEFAISEYFRNLFARDPHLLGGYTHWQTDFTCYDGNAQGFRVITKLQFIDDLYGLNLTKSCLASYLKYPNVGPGDKSDPNISCRKHGVFWADKDYLDRIMEGSTPIGRTAYVRHPFAFLVEAADTICYLSMDLEDAYNKGWFTLSTLLSSWQSFATNSSPTAKALFALLEKAAGTDGSLARKGFIQFRIAIIKHLVSIAVGNYLSNYDRISTGQYNQELIFDDTDNVALFLQEFCIRYIYSQKDIQSVELTGWSVINGLLDIYTKLFLSDNKSYIRHGEAMMSQSVLRVAKMDYLVHSKRIQWNPIDHCYAETSSGQKIDNTDALCDSISTSELPIYYRLRMIVDYISGMTDKFAVQHYQRLSGQRI